MKPIKILINGAQGKMGALSTTTLNNHNNFDVVACCDKEDNLHESIQASSPEVVLDFTSPDNVFTNSQLIIEHQVCPVIGTTGLTEQQIKELQTQCAQQVLGGMIVPNFALGANLMLHLAQLAAKYYGSVNIIEKHNEKKADSPSGTALQTAQLINKTYKENAIQPNNNANPATDCYQYQNIPIHSLRLPGAVAHQSVVFGGYGENFTITHDANQRECFMPGVILACQKVVNMKELTVGLHSILL